MNDLIHRLSNTSDNLTPAERNAVQYLEHNLDQIPYQTIQEVAELAKVSQASVVRAFRKLGYTSFAELKTNLRNTNGNRSSLTGQLELSMSAIDSNDPLASTYALDQQVLAHTYQNLDRNIYQTIVEKLATANRIGTIGFRASTMVAIHLAFMLNLARPGVSQLRLDYAHLYDQLLDFNKQDVIIALSFARPAQQTIQAVKYAKEHSVTIIGITDSLTSPLGVLADLPLIVQTEGTFFQSYTAVISVCTAIMAGVGQKLQDSAQKRIKELDAINLQSNVF